MRKTTIFTISFISLLLTLPAVAQVGYIWDDIQSYATDLNNYINNNVIKSVEQEPAPVLSTITQTSISTTKGRLNISDPLAAGQQVRDSISNYSLTSTNKFENNSSVYSNSLSNEVLRLLTRGTATGVLGEAGQIRTQQKLENIQEVVKSYGQNDPSPNLPPCPPPGDPLCLTTRQLLTTTEENVRIQKDQLRLNSESFAQSVRLEQSLQYTNLNLASVSQQLEENNRSRRVDSATEAARLLRVTAQSDLFGRKYDNSDVAPNNANTQDVAPNNGNTQNAN